MKHYFEKIYIWELLRKFEEEYRDNAEQHQMHVYKVEDKVFCQKNGQIRQFALIITDLVNTRINASGIQNGLVHCFSMHTTSGIVMQHFEHGFITDLFKHLQKNYFSKKYAHDIWEEEDHPGRRNADAHMMSVYTGTSCVVSVVEGKLQCGKFENIICLEFDARIDKEFCIQIFGE